MTGTLLSSTSRITPPAEPVIQPMMMATQKGWPMASVFCIPAMVKRASPNVSKTNHALSRRLTYLAKIMTESWARAVQLMSSKRELRRASYREWFRRRWLRQCHKPFRQTSRSAWRLRVGCLRWQRQRFRQIRLLFELC